MKTKTILLSLLLSVSAFAGTVVDKANMLGPQQAQLETEIMSLPVYIETHETLSDLRGYADNRVKQLTDKGFLLVLTSVKPRQWRISITPERVVSSEQTRLIGDRMASQIKQGKVYEGMLGASRELNQLMIAAQAINTSSPRVVQVEQAASHSIIKYDTPIVILIICAITGAFVLLIWGISKFLNRESAYKSNFRESDSFYGKSYSVPSKPVESKYTPVSGHREGYSIPKTNTIPVKTYVRPTNKKERIFESYSLAERKRMADKEYGVDNYDSNILNDAASFYVLYSAFNTPSTPTPSYTPPSTPSRSNDDDSYRRSSSSSSSSDSSSSYSSYDSSSSSYDSGSSSSDSGGSSGSCD